MHQNPPYFRSSRPSGGFQVLIQGHIGILEPKTLKKFRVYPPFCAGWAPGVRFGPFLTPFFATSTPCDPWECKTAHKVGLTRCGMRFCGDFGHHRGHIGDWVGCGNPFWVVIRPKYAHFALFSPYKGPFYSCRFQVLPI